MWSHLPLFVVSPWSIGVVDPILDIVEGNNDGGDEYDLIFVHISTILGGTISIIGLVNLE
jgi:hypothetical protein